MNAKELRKLSHYLRTEVSPRYFNLKYWKDRPAEGEVSCGTVACAVGHGLLGIPEWRDQGFVLLTGAYNDVPKYGHLVGWHAVAEFFRIPDDLAHYLFHESKYKPAPGEKTSPNEVADRIDEVLRKNGYAVAQAAA